MHLIAVPSKDDSTRSGFYGMSPREWQTLADETGPRTQARDRRESADDL
ncbi:hypothetical protein [Streptomyces luteogriseus]|nr:hypothetical protein [Streptomyces luteogriseus]WTJ26959.1 hypothetical protein OID52_07805 [Streptomyces luteogriseus]